MEKYITAEGLEKLKKELEDLKTVKRKEIAERLEKSISFGDNLAYYLFWYIELWVFKKIGTLAADIVKG